MTTKLIGQTLLTRYRIDSEIKAGGFATVYRATDTRFSSPVALKILHEHLTTEANAKKRFKREADTLFQLRKHPNIIKVSDFGEQDGMLILVMELVDGVDLKDLLYPDEKDAGSENLDSSDLTQERRATQLSLGHAVQIASDLCSALQHAHTQKEPVIHKDLKPSNVLINRNGQAMLTDFGIAAVLGEARLTRSGTAIGTAAYMSPEQVRGERNLDGRADLYALGVMLYEMCSGRLPFVGSDTAIIQMQLSVSPEPPTRFRKDIPAALEAVILRCLAKNPADRYPNAEALRQALLAAVNPQPLTDLLPSAAMPKPSPTPPTPFSIITSLLCPVCFSDLNLKQERGVCPACGSELTQAQGEAARRAFNQEAIMFIERFNVPVNAGLELRDMEYRRSIEPALVERYTNCMKEWEAIVSRGGVAAPTADLRKLADPQQILAGIKAMHYLHLLWSGEKIEWFLADPEKRRERDRRVSSLKRRALQLLGLFHSIKGALGEDEAQMRNGYTTARKWFDQAAQLNPDEEPVLSSTLEFQSQFTQAILDQPRDPKTEQPPAPHFADEYAVPGLRVDISAYNAFRGQYAASMKRISEAETRARTAIVEARQGLEGFAARFTNLDEEKRAFLEGAQERQGQISEAYEREVAQRKRHHEIMHYLVPILPPVIALLGSLLAWYLNGWSLLPIFEFYLPTLRIALGIFHGFFLLGGVLSASYLFVKFRREGPAEKVDLGPVILLILALVAPFVLFYFWDVNGFPRSEVVATITKVMLGAFFVLYCLPLAILLGVFAFRKLRPVFFPTSAGEPAPARIELPIQQARQQIEKNKAWIVAIAVYALPGLYFVVFLFLVTTPSVLLIAWIVKDLGWWGGGYARSLTQINTLATQRKVDKQVELDRQVGQQTVEWEKRKQALEEERRQLVESVRRDVNDLIDHTHQEGERLSILLLRSLVPEQLADPKEVVAQFRALE